MTRTAQVSTKLTLPTDYNEPSDSLLDYWLMVFGRKNIGKSTFGASYPDAITFMLERGRRNLAIRMVPKQGEKPLSMQTFMGYWKLFCESKDIQVAVIDTIDALYEMHYRDVLRRYGSNITKPQDTGDGPGVWGEIRDGFDDIFGMAQDAGKTVVFVSHEKEKEHQNADGTVLSRIEPSCTGQAITVVQRFCDYVFHYDWVCNDRVMTIRSTDNIVWTSCGRNETFLDPDGVELKRIKIPNNPDAGFDTLQDAFDGKLRDYDYVPPKKTVEKKPTKTGSANKR